MNETIATYAFDEDAAGLGPFVTGIMDALPNEEFVVYVTDDLGNAAKAARFVRSTLSDGSTVVDLIISFDR